MERLAATGSGHRAHRKKKSLASPGANVLYMFAPHDPPPSPRPSHRPDRLAGRPHRRSRRSGGATGGGRHAGGEHAALDATQAGALLARLRRLAARFRAVAGTPVPPPKPAPELAEPRFIPTHRFRDVSADPVPDPPRLPHPWRWLLRLLPQAAAGRDQLEALLRDPAMAEMLAADHRLGPILRPLGWMLGVDRALLPASRWRRRPVIMVPGGPAEVAAAAEEYACARAKTASWVDLLALFYVPARGRRERRLVWRGRTGLAITGLEKFLV